MNKTTYLLDGNQFDSLEEFAHYFSKTVLKGYNWNGNLDAFNDILRGGFGTPSQGFILLWKNSLQSRQKLGYSETVNQLQKQLVTCHPENREHVAKELESAKNQRGPTVFDQLVEIIRVHGPGGREAEDGVELILD